MEENGHLPVRLEGVDPAVTTREWLENVINGKIRPRIDGIRINPVTLTAPRAGTIFVVSVPASLSAPHMASDHKYYKRFNFQSVPMEHYELEDVRRRHTGPLLSLELSQLMPVGNNRVRVMFHMKNSSSVTALYSLVMLKVEGANVNSGNKWDSERAYRHGMLLQKNISVPDRLPLWQGVPISLGASVTLTCPDEQDFCLEWKFLSPDMSEQSGVWWFHVTNGIISEIADQALITILNERRATRHQGADTGILVDDE
jgi:hypothetical protein